jgi:hypothetical protein
MSPALWRNEELMESRERPKFTGVFTYRDPQGRFTLRFPSDWHLFELDQQLDGVLYSPHTVDPQTWVSIWVQKLEDAVVAEDAEDLQAGVDEGLAGLPECVVLTANNDVMGNLVRFERVYTFREGGAVRKRKAWLLYVSNLTIVLTFQGESEEEYEHWFAMANYSFNTFILPESLWFAADRDLNPHGIVM